MSIAAGIEPTPLLVLGDSRRRVLRAAISTQIAAWWTEWSNVAAEPVHVHVADDAKIDDMAQIRAGVFVTGSVGSEPMLYLQASADLMGPLLGMDNGIGEQGGSERSGELGRLLRAEVLESLCLGWLGASDHAIARVAEPTETRPAGMNDPPPGWLSVRIGMAVAKVRLDLLLHPRIVGRLLAERPMSGRTADLRRRREAIGSESIRIEAMLGSAEVSLSDLAALAEGDVIVLEQALSEPGYLLTSEGLRVANAAIGRLGAQRAIGVAKQS